MKTRVRELCEQGDKLFSTRQRLTALWQETAEHFYPERADFTTARAAGDEFAAHLMTGFPVMARRDLANQFAAMLRPRGKEWFELVPEDERLADDAAAKSWLQDKAAVLRRAMYDTAAKFVRATKEADHDFATFGQAVLTRRLNRANDGLLFQCHHLRDVAWQEGAEQEVDTIHHKHLYSARVLRQFFPKAVDPKVIEACAKEPDKEFNVRRIVIPSDEYDFYDRADRRSGERHPFMSIWVDRDHETILEEVPTPDHDYIVPRWQTVSGSQYAHSPATVIALADARLLQRITLTLLEAGEKAVNPPMVATHEVVRGDINIFAGATTWVDAEYDEKLGAALRTLDMGGDLAFGADMADRYHDLIKAAFYLDKIMLPPVGGTMTATEITMRNAEFIRAALPLFEPMEIEYNGALCEKTFDLGMRAGLFGPPDEMPRSLAGQSVKFAFQSPLQAASERQVKTAFAESAQLLAAAAEIDPSLRGDFDIRGAFRDALGAVEGAKADWIVPREEADKARAAQAEMQEMMGAADMIGQGAAVAEQVGKAGQSLMAPVGRNGRAAA